MYLYQFFLNFFFSQYYLISKRNFSKTKKFKQSLSMVRCIRFVHIFENDAQFLLVCDYWKRPLIFWLVDVLETTFEKEKNCAIFFFNPIWFFCFFWIVAKKRYFFGWNQPIAFNPKWMYESMRFYANVQHKVNTTNNARCILFAMKNEPALFYECQ